MQQLEIVSERKGNEWRVARSSGNSRSDPRAARSMPWPTSMPITTVQDMASGQITEYQLTNFNQWLGQAPPGNRLRLTAADRGEG